MFYLHTKKKKTNFPFKNNTNKIITVKLSDIINKTDIFILNSVSWAE